MHLITDRVDGHTECNSVERIFAEEKNKSKYLVFDSTDENKEVLKSTQNVGMGLKIKLKQ